MYSPESIISIFYDQYILFVGISCILSFFLYFLFKNQNFGLIDPMNFFWVFTFGTSYAVVIQLFVNGLISGTSFFIILYFFIILVISWYLGFYLKIINFGIKKINLNSSERSINFIISAFLLVYFSLSLFYVSAINWNEFFISRFEANKGFGFLARIIDVIRVFIIALAAIKISTSKGKNKLNWFLLFLFVLISSFLNGAKFSILESTYLVLIVLSLKSGKIIKLKLKNIFKFSFFSFFIFIFALIFTNELAKKIDYDSKYTNLPPALEMFVSRVIANGDMYYLGLPNDILYKINTSNFAELIVRPYLGNNLTSKLFSMPNSGESLNVGRAIWEYWFPFSISGGSTDHFDLAAYSYLGFLGGSILVFFIGFFIGRVNKHKILNMRKNLNFFTLSLFSIIYVKSYLLLLSPIVGITSILDVLVMYIFAQLCFKLMNRI